MTHATRAMLLMMAHSGEGMLDVCTARIKWWEAREGEPSSKQHFVRLQAWGMDLGRTDWSGVVNNDKTRESVPLDAHFFTFPRTPSEGPYDPTLTLRFTLFSSPNHKSNPREKDEHHTDDDLEFGRLQDATLRSGERIVNHDEFVKLVEGVEGQEYTIRVYHHDVSFEVQIQCGLNAIVPCAVWRQEGADADATFVRNIRPEAGTDTISMRRMGAWRPDNWHQFVEIITSQTNGQRCFTTIGFATDEGKIGTGFLMLSKAFVGASPASINLPDRSVRRSNRQIVEAFREVINEPRRKRSFATWVLQQRERKFAPTFYYKPERFTYLEDVTAHFVLESPAISLKEAHVDVIMKLLDDVEGGNATTFKAELEPYAPSNHAFAEVPAKETYSLLNHLIKAVNPTSESSNCITWAEALYAGHGQACLREPQLTPLPGRESVEESSDNEESFVWVE